MSAYDRFRDRVVAITGYTGREFRGRLSTRCPAHEDRGPSLSIRDSGDRVLVHCFAGCTLDEVLAAVGLARRDLFNEARAIARENFTLEKVLSRPRPVDPGWTYVCEPPDVPDLTRRAIYAASTAYDEKGNHPGGPVPPW